MLEKNELTKGMNILIDTIKRLTSENKKLKQKIIELEKNLNNVCE